MIKKKLIEVAMPLEVINKASAKEKSIRFGHPSVLHLYWARRPLSTCRAILFAQLVDDPSSHPDKFPTEKDQNKERNRLFNIMEQLVVWENSSNTELYKKANLEIMKYANGHIPSIYDPFSGGASIPLEAQRLGLNSFGSDLNPVAVMIGKAMLEIPPLFKDQKPVHPHGLEKLTYKNAEGLAEDVEYYGNLLNKKVYERIGHLYPEVDLPNKFGNGKAKVIAWIWTRTVPSPDPAFSNVEVPITTNFLLSSKKGNEAFVVPVVDKYEKTINFKIVYGGTQQEILAAKNGTKNGRGANFNCLMSNSVITSEYIKKISKTSGLGKKLIAVVAQGQNNRIYLSPKPKDEEIANSAKPEWYPEGMMNQKSPDLVSGRGYGFKLWSELFTDRQLCSLTTFSDLISDIKEVVEKDALTFGLSSSGIKICDKGISAKSYAEAVSVYLGLAVSKLSDMQNSFVLWSGTRSQAIHLFVRQAIPMMFDFAEPNVFGTAGGAYLVTLSNICRVIKKFTCTSIGNINHHDAQTVNYDKNMVISTDPPYYDNIGYADLSDFFYIWMKPSLRTIYPDLFNYIATPKSEELVALSHRHQNKDDAEKFFLNGMVKVMKNMAQNTSNDFPTTIYYAFKQSEIEKEGVSSVGWSTFLQAVISAGYTVVGTWPVRTEMPNRMIASGTNALANSIVLVCRKREVSLTTITRAEFVRQLKTELPNAINNLKAANISPADIPQSSIGPGIGIFSRYQAVLENDDSHMSVKTALQIINRELGEEEGEYDSETSFAITWFEQYGFNVDDSGSAINIANAKGISINTLVHSGVAQSSGGKFSLLNRESLEDGWDPTTDKNLTIWECCQYLIKTLEHEGEFEAAKLLKKMGSSRADAAKELAYSLYDIAANKRKDANEATAYNGLIAVWSELTAQAANITDEDLRGDAQMRMI